MNKSTIISFLFMVGILPTVLSKDVNSSLFNTSNVKLTGLKDGWYTAVIQYSNYSTGTNKTYALNVKVEYNNVIKIDFGNGGSVHSGYNNEGYSYSGGYLSFENDSNGNILAAKTTVTVFDNNGTRTYKIRIE